MSEAPVAEYRRYPASLDKRPAERVNSSSEQPPASTLMMQRRNLPAFALMDALRRAQGNALGMLGLDPAECDYEVIANGSYWRLRRYSGPTSRTSLLIVAGPIKRPYIWDLAPPVSAIRYCLEHQFGVHLLEWATPTEGGTNAGIDEYAEVIAECVVRIADETEGKKLFLVGHSLGGTLAAIAAALQPKSIRGLALLAVPLCFEPGRSQFADAIASMDPSTLTEAEVVPGSFLSQISAVASPETFIWSRMRDAALSLADPVAVGIHARVERWALDEVPLPGRLVYQIFQWLYRENRFCHGILRVGGRTIGPSDVDVPTIAVVNIADEIANPASIQPFLDAMPTRDVRLIEYPGESGVALQHVAVLVGRKARAVVWPQIAAWLMAR